MTKTFLIFLLTFILLSCKDDKTVGFSIKDTSIEWDIFKIKVDDETITVPFNADTSYYFKILKDTVYFKKHKHFESVSKKFTLSKAEKDSLLVWATDAITKPVSADDQHVSDYAGKYVSISLSYGNTKISCGYSSIYTWTGISATLLKINAVTFEKIR